MDGVILIIAVVVGFIISIIGAKKLGQAVYDKTGYNAFNEMNKLLCYSIIVLPFGIGIAGKNTPNIKLMVISSIIPIVILLVQNLKVKKPLYIAGLTIFQIFFGISGLMFLLLNIVFKYAFKMVNFDIGVNIDTTQGSFNETLENVKLSDEAKKKSNNEQAEAWAQNQGFQDADEAERMGIRTGKERKI